MFYVFPNVSMGANDPRHVADLDPVSMIGKIYIGHH